MFLRKYATGTGADVYLPIVKRGSVDFAVGADWTPTAGDVTVSKDGGAAANINNAASNPVAVTMGNTAMWKFTLSDAELTCKTLAVFVADASSKAVEDQAFVVETYGHANALHPLDLGTALASQTVGLTTAAMDALLDRAIDEPTSVPAWPMSLRKWVGWGMSVLRNKVTQTASQLTVRNDADNGTIGTATVSDDGTTMIRGEYS